MSLLIRFATDTVRSNLHGSTSEMNQREKIVPKRSANLKGVEPTEMVRRRFGNSEITNNPPIISPSYNLSTKINIGKQGPLVTVTTMVRAITITLSTNLPMLKQHPLSKSSKEKSCQRQPRYAWTKLLRGSVWLRTRSNGLRSLFAKVNGWTSGKFFSRFPSPTFPSIHLAQQARVRLEHRAVSLNVDTRYNVLLRMFFYYTLCGHFSLKPRSRCILWLSKHHTPTHGRI